MRFTIFMPVVAIAVLMTVAMANLLDRKTSARTIIPLTYSKHPSLSNADDTVNLNALYSHVESVDTKILRGFENYEKNTGIPHPLAVKEKESKSEPPNSKRAGSGASLTNFNDRIWYTTIWIGTPARPFAVNVDTGSSDVFIPGPTCSQCEGHTKWDPESSQSSADKNMVFKIQFANGAIISGKQYDDNVTIAGLTADHQTIGAATTYAPTMGVNRFPPDGMFGMAFQSISRFPDSPLFETLINEEKVEEPVFSIKLSSSGGELYLGGSNRDLYTGELAYTDIIVVGFWQVVIAIQGNRETLFTDVPATIDTGTNWILGDTSRVSDLHTTLGGKSVARGFYSFPCNAFPTISFAFGGTSGGTFQIPASLLNLGPVSSGSPDCFSGIVSYGTTRKHWTIGATFLMSVYTVFDFGNKRVGFADLAT